MKIQKISAILILIVGIVLAACALASAGANEPTGIHAEKLTGLSVGEAVPCKDVENCTFLIDGRPITLVNGVSENEITPGSGIQANHQLLWQ